jgi:glycosyltransferase involved in cell wall biosynthesis
VVDVASIAAPPVARPVPRAAGPAIGTTFSVVVPTKNERQNLPRFLASLPGDVELVLCDASDDGTPELALAHRPRNTVVLAAPGSIATARQAGAEIAGGDVLVFADADVEFEARYFERLRALMTPSPWPACHPARDRCAARTSATPTSSASPNPRGSERGKDFPWDAICGPKLSRDTYSRYYQLVSQAQQITYSTLGIVGASGSNMVVTRAAFKELGGFRLDLSCNEDTELFLRAGRRRFRVHFEPDLVVWATDHRRLRRGLVRKSAHSLIRNALLFLVCKRPGLPRLLVHDWGYWSTSRSPEPRHASGFDSV